MNNNIGIIVNESSKIGSGHLQRCLNLTSQLFKKSRKFYFFSNKKILKKNNNTKINIVIKEQNQIKYNKEKFFLKIKKYIQEKKISILIIDLYDIKSDLEKRLRKIVKRLIVFDDFIDNKHHCDILINNNYLNPIQKKQIRKNNSQAKLFLGEKYFLLNKKLIKYKHKYKYKYRYKNKIFIFFGNAEQNSETLKIIKILISFQNIVINCVIGKFSKDKKEIIKICKNYNFINLYYKISNRKMFEIMGKSDFSIGSGGVNLLERLSMGMPSIVFATSNNQLSNVINLGLNKKIIYVGKSNDKNLKKIKKITIKHLDKVKLFNRIPFKSNKISYVKDNLLLSRELNKLIK